ncbi:carbon storage regulator CsrA [Brevibacillus choshinensis]|uniref:Translational regulator CsrA n=1 Tax=Brevibacillus choshinensis TaxID=54911 RepID=A0ABX7FM46_BRECH|nr:carbon storage regulator CsrA [Brevibacillus choshinensis]QRG67318.1 carbon storage regulator CsrA [Brevibacillus choshinensis]
MLVLSRKKNESLMIGDQIKIKIVAVEGDVVKIGIEAPRDVEVYRHEIYVAIKEENRMASQNKMDLSQLKEWIKSKPDAE